MATTSRDRNCALAGEAPTSKAALTRFSTPITQICFRRVAYVPALAPRSRSVPWLGSVARAILVPE